jgi:uncharacterized membrane protein required for colicin V production
LIIDVALAFIVLFFLFLGFKNGFIRTVLHTFGWIIAIVAAALLRKPFCALLEKHTTLYEHLYERIEKLLTSLSGNLVDGVTGGANSSGIPGILDEGLHSASDSVTRVAAEQAADVLFVIIAFLALLFLVKLILSILTLIFSKKSRGRGLVGGIDGLAGALLGLAQAALLVFALLALLLPVSYLINTDAYNWVVHQMDRSVFSQYLYEHNLLLSVVREYVPSDLLPAEWFA